ncbi:dipeptide ABC transporter ATP-binding protein [Ensifer soli]|uniref:dipeptide ABC transporter ATP-binding protein n=1 Tax=Ciceribacter sp. sgz301302 TaxID=3342379 RepID=UPI0035B76761
MQPLLSIRNLSIAFGSRSARHRVVSDVSLDLFAGQVMGLVGESGSGKTTVALHALGYRPKAAVLEGGSIDFGGRDILRLDPVELSGLRGNGIAYVPQNPGAALNPTRRVGSLMTEMIRHHLGSVTRTDARDRALALLGQVGLPNPARIFDRYPHELSGGQQQRVVIAMAIACEPSVIVLDEPTTGLDTSTQKGILSLLRSIRDRNRVAMLYVTHDLPLLREIATHVAVMKRGVVVETGPLETVFSAPRHDYTRHLLSCVPSVEGRSPDADADPDASTAPTALRFDRLVVDYSTTSQIGLSTGAPHRALNEISLSIGEGEICALVGESGSGKSTLARALAGLVSPSDGRMELAGVPLPGALRRRGKDVLRQIGFVFQNPDLSLNPRRRVGSILADALSSFERVGGREAARRVEAGLAEVALPAAFARRYPHELSGGQRQRVAIARALISRPKILICDEVLTALDVSVQAEILDLLVRLRREFGLTILFISHDLAVVRSIADRVTVLKDGEIVVADETEKVFRPPFHPYVRHLLSAVPGATLDAA